MLRRIGELTLLIAVVVGCSAAPVARLRTAPAPAQACMDALIGGALAKHAQSGLGITSADGQATPVEWPFGYTARNELGRVVLLDETGKVVAREGDEVQVGGGFGDQVWHACGGVNVTRAAS